MFQEFVGSQSNTYEVQFEVIDMPTYVRVWFILLEETKLDCTAVFRWVLFEKKNVLMLISPSVGVTPPDHTLPGSTTVRVDETAGVHAQTDERRSGGGGVASHANLRSADQPLITWHVARGTLKFACLHHCCVATILSVWSATCDQYDVLDSKHFVTL